MEPWSRGAIFIFNLLNCNSDLTIFNTWNISRLTVTTRSGPGWNRRRLREDQHWQTSGGKKKQPAATSQISLMKPTPVDIRSETVFSHQPSRASVREQRQRHSSLEKITISSSSAIMLDPPSHSSSSVVECELNSSPVLERPNTLPELNSRPASRVMKSFSCDGVRSGGLSLDFI